MPEILNIRRDYLACYEDPQNEAGFDADCLPAEQSHERCAPDGVDDLKNKFIAVYARRNACVRQLSALDDVAPERAGLISLTVKLTEAIDHLEDVCAPIGFIAEPVMDEEMFVSEIVFTHAPMANANNEPFESSFSLYIPIPWGEPDRKEQDDAP